MKDRKFERAKTALDEMFSDQSVSAVKTLEYLEELQSDIEGKIDALRADVDRGAAK